MIYNSREALPLCITLAGMVHPQPQTTVTVENDTAHEFTMGVIVPKQPKYTYTIFHLIKFCAAQNIVMENRDKEPGRLFLLSPICPCTTEQEEWSIWYKVSQRQHLY